MRKSSTSLNQPFYHERTSLGGFNESINSISEYNQDKKIEKMLENFGLEFWNDYLKKQNKIQKGIHELEEKLEQQNTKNIEIIGLFSAILAFIIIDVNVIKAAPNFLAAILLISALTASLVVFASFIHILFSAEEKKSSNMWWWGIGLLVLFITIGVLAYVFEWDLYKDKGMNSKLQGKDKNYSLEMKGIADVSIGTEGGVSNIKE